jgi:nucleoside-diphosphate-sugar epimerase
MPLLDIEYYGMRFGSVNGWAPNMRTDLMINSMTSSALHKKEVSVFNAHAFRPIISTFDIAQSIEAVIEAGDKRGIYNLSSFNLNIGEIGRRVAEYLGVPLVDNGRTNTYNFTISSEKFKSTFDFDFYSSVESIVQSILDRPYNKNWGRRDSHE